MNTLHPQSLPVPCAAWANRLAALHPADLAPDEKAALKKHIAGCSDCAAVYTAYQEVDALIKSLPVVQPFPQRVAQLERMIADQTHDHPRWKPASNTREHRPLPARASTQLARRVSLLAAVLIVMVLVASAFALFSAHHNTSISTGKQGIIYSVSGNAPGYSTVYALDAATGQTIWSTPLHMLSNGRPLHVGKTIFLSLMHVSGSTIFLSSSDYYLYALHTSDGHLLWQRSYQNLMGVDNKLLSIIPDPVSDENAIYFGTTRGIYAWGASDGRQLWSYPIPGACNQQPDTCISEALTVNNGIVYTYFNGLYALNASNGSLRWHDPQVTSTHIVVAQNHIYALRYDEGTIRVLQADTGKLLNTPGLPHIAPDDRLNDTQNGYLRSDDLSTDGQNVYLQSSPATANSGSDAYAIQATDNTVLWHRHYTQNIAIDMVNDGHLYYEYDTQDLSAFQLKPPKPTPGSQTGSSVKTDMGQIRMVAHICTVSTADGSPQGCVQASIASPFAMSDRISSFSRRGTTRIAYAAASSLVYPIAMSQGTMFVRGDTGLYATRVADGKVLWRALANNGVVEAVFA